MYKINPKILQTPVSEGNILLLEPQQGLYFELNEVSAIIYECVHNGICESDILLKITKSFDVSYDTAQADLKDLLQQLINNNIIINSDQ